MHVPDDVLAVLDRAVTDGPALRLTGQLDRDLYVRTDKVLKAAGGKWNRSARAHLFEQDAADAIEPVILTGQVVNRQQELGYFPTPAPVVARLLDLAAIEPGMRVLEPSAGRGAIALAAARAGADVDCVEIDAANAAVLRDQHHPRIGGVIVADFLTTAPQPAYDRVVMNPPFARQQDIAHVQHALRALAPGGRLVAVMSASVTFRTGKAADFRQMVDDRGGVIEPLPENAFRESGTGVRTVTCVIPATN